MNIQGLQEKTEKLSERLHTLLLQSSLPGILQDAVFYAVGAGKKLRPLIVLLTAETLGKPWEKALDIACALEMIHSYSLIHDDLPCMDDDDFRRGKPSLHKAYGEAFALLTGDLLLTYAFEVIAASDLPPAKKTSLILLLASRAGGKGMIAGQAEDLASEGKMIHGKTLYAMEYKKTALLFMTAFEFGAIYSDASVKDQKVLREFGKRLGIAYQIRDDLEDSSENHSDVAKKKATAVSVFGKEKAEHLLQSLYLQSLAKLSLLSTSASPLKNLAYFLLNAL